MEPTPAPHATVKYRDALWYHTIEDCREIIAGRPGRAVAGSVATFLAVAAVTYFIQGSETIEPYVVPALVGLAGVVFYFAGIFLARLCYFTPKRICQSLQLELAQAREELTSQLEQQRLKYKSEILAEKAATRKALDARDELLHSQGEPPEPRDLI